MPRKENGYDAHPLNNQELVVLDSSAPEQIDPVYVRLKLLEPFSPTNPPPAEFMSSSDLAAITGKPQHNIKRTMTSLKKQGKIAVTQVEFLQPAGNRGYRKSPIYLVNERDSYRVMQRINPAFAEDLMRYWQGLDPETFVPPPQSAPVELKPAPKRDVWKNEGFKQRFAEADQLTNVRDTATFLKANEHEFTTFLLNRGYCTRKPARRCGNGDYRVGQLWPVKKYMQAGYFELEPFVKPNFSGFQMKFTNEGLIWIYKNWTKYLTKRQLALESKQNVLPFGPGKRS